MENTVCSNADRVTNKFIELFNETPRLFRSPGRINLIGEHTDYNQGLVLPAGVDKAIFFAITPRSDNRVILHAIDLDASYEGTLDDLSKPEATWAWYQFGVLDQLQKNGYPVGGFQTVFGGDIPVGGGMSSSAALECCLLFALNELFGLGLDRMDIVRLGQKVENEYVGVQSGIMDQFASTFGREESVIRLDCRSLEYEYFPFPMDEYLLVLCDTTVKHSLASSEYNTRRQECEAGVAILRSHHPDVHSLRDATPGMVEQHREEMGDVIYRRCKYVTEEIQRVQVACELLLQGDLPGFGKKMYETHEGLQHEYEVSCEELDFLVEQARSNPDVLGARMMGGGFGGCTINLIKNTAIEAFEQQMKEAYQQAFGRDLPCYRVRITDGTGEVHRI